MKLNNVVYEVNQSIADVEGEVCLGYGVTAFANGKVEKEIKHISLDYVLVKELVKRFNEKELSLNHLEDVIEDLLSNTNEYEVNCSLEISIAM